MQAKKAEYRVIYTCLQYINYVYNAENFELICKNTVLCTRRDLNLRNISSYVYLRIYFVFHKTQMDSDIIIAHRQKKKELLKHTCI